MGTSFTGGTVPNQDAIEASDFILLHGNGVEHPERISEMVADVRKSPGYKTSRLYLTKTITTILIKKKINLLMLSDHTLHGAILITGGRAKTTTKDISPFQLIGAINSDRKKAFFTKLYEFYRNNGAIVLESKA